MSVSIQERYEVFFQMLVTYSHRNRPDLSSAASAKAELIWPEFMLHDPIGNRYWQEMYELFPDYHFSIVDDETDQVVGLINSIPIQWNQPLNELPIQGWDWAIETGVEQGRSGVTPNIQCALQVALLPEFQGKGASAQMLKVMKSVGQARGLHALVAPVRPSWKHRYPLIPMEQYVRWRREDGLMFDPWLRVHERLGARFSHIATQSMEISAPIAEWEKWTGLQMPETGEYVIPGALVQISVDRMKDVATYFEPNVWMIHPMEI